MTRFLRILVMTLGMTTMAHAAAPQIDARAAIEACVQHYFNASDGNAPDELAKGFQAGTLMFWATEHGTLTSLSQPQWRARLAKATEKRVPVARKLDIIEQAGDAALVHVRSDFATFAFDDSLLLLKLGGGWKMVGKVFFRGPQQQPAPAPAEERQAVEQVIRTKLAAMDSSDGAKLASSYAPRASTFTVDNGEIIAWPIAEWVARYDENRRAGQAPAPAKRTLRRIEVAGTIASAVFDHDFGDHRVTDLANLVKTSDGWHIVQLVYVRAPN